MTKLSKTLPPVKASSPWQPSPSWMPIGLNQVETEAGAERYPRSLCCSVETRSFFLASRANDDSIWEGALPQEMFDLEASRFCINFCIFTSEK